MSKRFVETCISFMGFDLVRMVRSVETKRMRGTKERNRMTGRIHIRILSQHPLQILFVSRPSDRLRLTTGGGFAFSLVMSYLSCSNYV